MPIEIFGFFHQLGMMKWPLALCSILGIAICIERLVFILRIASISHKHFQDISYELRNNMHLLKPIRDEIVNMQLSRIQARYYGSLKALRMIGTISPMVGLLGTILGIINAFQKISEQIGPVSPSVIADGLWEAMLTTAVGLMIALPALLLAYLFRHVSEKYLEDICLRLNALSLSFEIDQKSDA